MIPVFPWVIRNKAEVGAWGISSVTAYNLYHYNVPGFLESKDMSDTQAVSFVAERAGVSDQNTRSLSYSSHLMHGMEQIILSDPWGYIKYHWEAGTAFIASSGINIFDATNLGAYDHMLYSGRIPKIVFAAECAFWVIVLGLACMSWLFFRKEGRVLLFLVMIFYFWLMTGPVAYARYRLPAEPFLLILAVGGLEYVYGWCKNKMLRPRT
jgi:hypothetical protein